MFLSSLDKKIFLEILVEQKRENSSRLRFPTQENRLYATLHAFQCPTRISSH